MKLLHCFFFAAYCILLASCNAVKPDNATNIKPANSVSAQTSYRYILPAKEAEFALWICDEFKQSKRHAWQPTPDNIRQFELLLAPALMKEPEAEEIDFSKAPEGWLRQYVGIQCGPNQLIVGNYIPNSDDDFPYGNPAKDWISINDGGPSIFQAVFDTKTGKFVSFFFNGVA